MAMIVNGVSNGLERDPNIDVDFGDGIFTLNYFGSYRLFLNNYVSMVKSFTNRVINEYYDATVQPDPDKRYRECLAEWYAETTLIDYPDRFRKENNDV